MRLWHKDLIPVLPRQQLLAQWRECCCIARNIAVNGTTNHILVNEILEYKYRHFASYCRLVYFEMIDRGYKVSDKSFEDLQYNLELFSFQQMTPCCIRLNKDFDPVDHIYIFNEWHNDRYLKQCFYNLQEKYDRSGITENEWKKILEKVSF